MDRYKVLGVRKNASKEEIKQAFRELAKQFHPDKHSQSSTHSRDSATFKFKQLSEAYETLIDDRKRADYDISRNAYGAAQNKRYDYARDRGGGRNSYGNGYGYSGSASRAAGDFTFAKLEMGLRYLTTGSFLRNATFAGISGRVISGRCYGPSTRVTDEEEADLYCRRPSTRARYLELGCWSRVVVDLKKEAEVLAGRDDGEEEVEVHGFCRVPELCRQRQRYGAWFSVEEGVWVERSWRYLRNYHMLIRYDQIL